jgi:hypothetical protein
MERLPVCCPALEGSKPTWTVQEADISRAAPQVDEEIWNPAEDARVRSGMAMGPVFVTVSAREALISPTPVVGNTIELGCTCTNPAAPPTPAREAIAGSGKDAEATDSVPLTTPFAVGVKITPTEQVAPEARVVPQVFCVRLNGVEAATVSCDAVTLLVFAIVAICAAVDWPSLGCRKLNCDGVIASNDVPCPTPDRLT